MKCARAGCTRTGIYYPVLLIYPDPERFPTAAPARAVCGLPTCSPCTELLTVEDLVVEKGWQQIVLTFALAGKAPPHRPSTRLEFVPIGSAEAQAFEATRRRMN